MSGRWWKESWNPVTGCTPVSAGCDHCYAKAVATTRLRGVGGYPADEPFRVTVHEDRMDKPLRWTKPRRVFVNSMSDLFHDDVPSETIDAIFATMWACPQHTFIICTKRPERMLDYMNGLPAGEEVPRIYANLHLGVTVEREDYLHRAETLLQTPAAVRWLSCEPLLGPLNLLPVLADSLCSNCGWLGFTDNDTPEGGLRKDYENDADEDGHWVCPSCEAPEEGSMLDYSPGYNPTGPNSKLDWIVVGCESGTNARPCKVEWVESIVEQCKRAGVAVWVKQLNIGGKVTSDLTKFPEHLQLRQLPGGET